MTISELADTLHRVADALERVAAYAAAARPPLDEAKAILRGVKRTEDGWYPVELDLALSELAMADDLIARGRQAVLDYLTRL